MRVGDAFPLLHVTLAALGSLVREKLVALVAQGFPDVCGVERSSRTPGPSWTRPGLESSLPPGQLS